MPVNAMVSVAPDLRVARWAVACDMTEVRLFDAMYTVRIAEAEVGLGFRETNYLHYGCGCPGRRRAAMLRTDFHRRVRSGAAPSIDCRISAR